MLQNVNIAEIIRVCDSANAIEEAKELSPILYEYEKDHMRRVYGVALFIAHRGVDIYIPSAFKQCIDNKSWHEACDYLEIYFAPGANIAHIIRQLILIGGN